MQLVSFKIWRYIVFENFIQTTMEIILLKIIKQNRQKKTSLYKIIAHELRISIVIRFFGPTFSHEWPPLQGMCVHIEWSSLDRLPKCVLAVLLTHSWSKKSICGRVNVKSLARIRNRLAELSFPAAKRYAYTNIKMTIRPFKTSKHIELFYCCNEIKVYELFIVLPLQ